MTARSYYELSCDHADDQGPCLARLSLSLPRARLRPCAARHGWVSGVGSCPEAGPGGSSFDYDYCPHHAGDPSPKTPPVHAKVPHGDLPGDLSDGQWRLIYEMVVSRYQRSQKEWGDYRRRRNQAVFTGGSPVPPSALDENVESIMLVAGRRLGYIL